MAAAVKISWSDLEVGMQIEGGWEILGLTPTHISVLTTDGGVAEFLRKDPWETVEIVPMKEQEIVDAFGGHIIHEERDGEMTYYAWPADPDFRAAAQSHLEMVHHTAVGDRSYADLIELHEQLHHASTDHIHINREDSSDEK